MILVTVGTNEQPFDRLVRAAAALDVDEPLVVQHGSSKVAHGPGLWVDFVSYEELSDHMQRARAVVCHGGVGSIMLARRHGHRPLVVARRLHLGEAVDDHQLPIMRRLHASGVVRLVEDERDLTAALAVAPERVAPDELPVTSGAAALAGELRSYLDGIVQMPSPQPGPSVSVPAGGRG
jgi:UDP-N-acetylglucosamine transferase subunit ALG13